MSWYSHELVDAAIVVVFVALPIGWMLWQECREVKKEV